MFLHCLYFAFGMWRDLNWLEGLDAWNDDKKKNDVRQCIVVMFMEMDDM